MLKTNNNLIMTFKCFDCCFGEEPTRVSPFLEELSLEEPSPVVPQAIPKAASEPLAVRRLSKGGVGPLSAIVNSVAQTHLNPSLTIYDEFKRLLDEWASLFHQLKDPTQQLDLIEALSDKTRALSHLVSEKLDRSRSAGSSVILSTIPIDFLVHELRAPLQGIRFSLDSEAEIGELNELFAHLEELVEGLREQPLGVEYSFFSFATIEQKIRSVIGPSAKKKEIEVSFNWPEIHSGLSGDKAKMTQVLINFANNAVKYGKQGGKIEISAEIDRASKPPYCLLTFHVKDDGPGIATEKQKELFKPFSTVGSVADPTMESSGVGLYLCQRFIAALNSDLEDPSNNVVGVKSELGVGSDFWFTALAKSPQPVAPLSPASPVAKEIFRPGVRVLVADDSNTIQMLLQRTLVQRGAAAQEVVGSGRVAVEKFKEGTYNVVLLDENMGEKDIGGSKAAKQIWDYCRENKKTPPQIYLITGENPESAASNLDPSIKDHVTVLTKPTDFNAIVRQVNHKFSSAQ